MSFDSLYHQAKVDLNIVGLFLSGSRGKGFEHQYSDYDIRLVRTDDANQIEVAEAYKSFEEIELFDIGIKSLDDFRSYAAFDSKSAWDRYSFSHVQALIDKIGEVQNLIDAKGKLPEEKREGFLRGQFDAYINHLYRSLKCHRIGNLLGAKLEAGVSIGYLLHVIFGLEGRHAPYLGYLERELEHYPLTNFPLDSNQLIQHISDITDTANISTQQQLLKILEQLFENEGMSDVVKGWGKDYHWMMKYRDDENFHLKHDTKQN